MNVVVLTLLLVCLPACGLFAGRPVAIPQELLSSSLRYPLQGGINILQHTVKFGPYQARHAWVGPLAGSGTEPNVFNRQVERTVWKQTGTFDFQVISGKPFRGMCNREQLTVTQHYKDGLLGRGSEQQPPRILEHKDHLWCKLTREGSPTLILDTDGYGAGEIRGSAAKLTFAQLAAQDSPYETITGGPLGFLLEANDQQIAAIDLSRSAVLLRRTLSPLQRDDAAAILITLMMMSKLMT